MKECFDGFVLGKGPVDPYEETVSLELTVSVEGIAHPQSPNTYRV